MSTTLISDDLVARLRLARAVEPGDAEIGALVARDGAAQVAELLTSEHPANVDPRRRGAIRARLAAVDPARELEMTARLGARILTPESPEWPSALDDLGPAAPLGLWVNGNGPLRPPPAIAVVGARSATEYGAWAATDLAAGLCDAGYAVVSGAAFGIDAAAHRGALAADGLTLGVLAGGIDVWYPRGNDRIIRQISETGWLLSESPPGSEPMRHRFLTRNRLIAALAQVTVVVEAAARSGSLSTARWAMKLVRPVAAFPGPVTSAMSCGTHRLVREGEAVLVTSAADVIELAGPIGVGLGGDGPVPLALDQLDSAGTCVYDSLPKRRGLCPDELALKAGFDPATVAARLGQLEILGLACQIDGRWRKS